MNAELEEGPGPEHEGEVPIEKGRAVGTRNPGSATAASASKSGVKAHRGRITVEGEGVLEPAPQLPDEPSDAPFLAISERGSGGQLIVPSREELEAALARANTLEELVSFEKMVAVMKAAGEQFRLAIDEAIRIASFDLVTRRKIGSILLQVNRRGGDRAKRHDASLLEKQLQELGKDKVKRCREIARTEASAFADYLKLMTEKHAVPTEAGMLRHARKAKATEKWAAKPRKAKSVKVAATGRPVLSRAILECVQRVMGDIDVCVGDADVKCRVRLRPETARLKQLRGTVFVAECLFPAEWLTKLAGLRRSTGLDAVLVALPAETSAEWFRKLMDGEDEWACCFLTGVLPPVMLAYLGHREGFKVACAEMGSIVRSLCDL